MLLTGEESPTERKDEIGGFSNEHFSYGKTLDVPIAAPEKHRKWESFFSGVDTERLLLGALLLLLVNEGSDLKLLLAIAYIML